MLKNIETMPNKIYDLSVLQRIAVRLATKVRADADLDEDSELMMSELVVLLETLVENTKQASEAMDSIVYAIEQLEGGSNA